jgi:hypothetical protein
MDVEKVKDEESLPHLLRQKSGGFSTVNAHNYGRDPKKPQ